MSETNDSDTRCPHGFIIDEPRECPDAEPTPGCTCAWAPREACELHHDVDHGPGCDGPLNCTCGAVDEMAVDDALDLLSQAADGQCSISADDALGLLALVARLSSSDASPAGSAL